MEHEQSNHRSHFGVTVSGRRPRAAARFGARFGTCMVGIGLCLSACGGSDGTTLLETSAATSGAEGAVPGAASAASEDARSSHVLTALEQLADGMAERELRGELDPALSRAWASSVRLRAEPNVLRVVDAMHTASEPAELLLQGEPALAAYVASFQPLLAELDNQTSDDPLDPELMGLLASIADAPDSFANLGGNERGWLRDLGRDLDDLIHDVIIDPIKRLVHALCDNGCEIDISVIATPYPPCRPDETSDVCVYKAEPAPAPAPSSGGGGSRQRAQQNRQ